MNVVGAVVGFVAGAAAVLLTCAAVERVFRRQRWRFALAAFLAVQVAVLATFAVASFDDVPGWVAAVAPVAYIALVVIWATRGARADRDPAAPYPSPGA